MENTYNDNDLVVGLDIGTTKIATVIGYRNENGQINVTGHGVSVSSGVEFGEICNINHTVDGILRSKAIAEEHAKANIRNVYVGIAGHHIKTSKYTHHLYRYNNNDPISQEEIDDLQEEIFQVVVSPGEEIIDVIPQHYLVDNVRETPDPVGELGNEITCTYQLVTGKAKEIDKIKTCGKMTELNLNEIVLEPIASGLACLSEEEKRNGVALVDIGGGTTDLIIFINGCPVYTKVISLGGNVITHDIAQVCKISKEMAEQIKIKYGTCVVDKSNENNLVTIPRNYGQEPIQINENYIAQIINARVQGEILGAISKEIRNSGYKDQLLSGIVLTGGGANLRHIRELCQFTLQLPTRIGIPENGFSRNIPSELKQPMFSTALGLLKYGIEAEEYLRSRNDVEEEEEKGFRIFGKKTNKDKEKPTCQYPNPNKGGKEGNKWGFFNKVHDWLVSALDNVY